MGSSEIAASVVSSSAETLAAFPDTWHLKGFAAATRNRYGKGTAYYVGTVVKEDAFYDALLADLLKAARVRPVVRPPAGVEVSVRQGQGRKVLFLLNHLEQPMTVEVPPVRLGAVMPGSASITLSGSVDFTFSTAFTHMAKPITCASIGSLVTRFGFLV